jgi:hypothetical protein
MTWRLLRSPVMLTRLDFRAFAALAVLSSVGCHTAPLRQPPGLPPSEPSINREEPGGDAADPHEAALLRLAAEPWGWRNDKQDALHVPLPDWQNWRRIRYFGIPSFVGFRYGDDHHAVIAIWVRDAEEATSPDACLESFEQWAAPTAHDFSVKVGPATASRAPWPSQDPASGGADGELAVGAVAVKSVDAEVTALFSKKTYAAAYAAYIMWPKTCTVFGIAVPVRDSEELARKVRDRYVSDGFWRMERHLKVAPQH